MKHYKEIQMRFMQRLNQQRAATGNPKIMEKHFSIFKKAVKDYISKKKYSSGKLSEIGGHQMHQDCLKGRARLTATGYDQNTRHQFAQLSSIMKI